MLKVEKLEENQKTKYKNVQRKNKGITLIALVITIIVILILAGVSINTLFGDNGLLTKAQDAVNANTRAGIKDQIVTEVFASYNNKGEIDKSQLNDNLKAHIPGITHDGESLEENPITTLPANVEKDGYKFTIEADGTVTDILVGGNQQGGGSGGGEQTVVDNVKIPEGYTAVNPEATKAEGIIIKDSNNNEFVWIEVPKTKEVYVKTGLGITDFDKNYENIYNDLKTYSSTYGIPNDIYYEDCGLTLEKYNEYKKKMLKSVYENGGFWIGRYEAGIDEPRTSSGNVILPALSQKDKYPYNYITIIQAQELAEAMSTSEDLTSSLMFGVQWDLVCKFLETTLVESKINSDSGEWGNYLDTSFTIDRGKCSVDDGNTWKAYSDPEISEYVEQNGEKYIKKKNQRVLLTTGASDRNSILNIYDFAGNEYEWTLEKSTFDMGDPCFARGGEYTSSSAHPASDRGECWSSRCVSFLSFRVTLY